MTVERALRLIAGAFVVMTAGACPPELCELFPEAYTAEPPLGQADSDTAPQPELEPEPDLAEVDPEEGRT